MSVNNNITLYLSLSLLSLKHVSYKIKTLGTHMLNQKMALTILKLLNRTGIKDMFGIRASIQWNSYSIFYYLVALSYYWDYRIAIQLKR